MPMVSNFGTFWCLAAWLNTKCKHSKVERKNWNTFFPLWYIFPDDITKWSCLWLLSTFQANQLLQSDLHPPCGPLLSSLECFKVCLKELIGNISFFNCIKYCDVKNTTRLDTWYYASKNWLKIFIFLIEYKHNQVPGAWHVLLCQKLHHRKQHCWGFFHNTILTSSMANIYFFVFADLWIITFISKNQ